MLQLVTANRIYSSWSLRPWVLMKALGIGFDDRQVAFESPDNHDLFRAFAPNGKVPALIDGDRVVWDSLAIALYLADRFAGVWPTDPDAKAWAQSVVAEMHSGFAALRNECPMCIGITVERFATGPALARDIARVAELLEEGLGRFGGPWLAGDAFTVADAFYAPVAHRIASYGLAVGPLGSAWVDRLLDHPAMREWEAAALAERHREIQHEQEIAACGRIVADRRATA